MSSSNCCFLSCIQISQEAGQVVWYSHFFQNFPQFIVIHTVKGFGIVNKAEIDVFLNSLAFSMIQQMLAIWSLVPLPLLKPAWTSGSSRFTYCWSLACRILSITSPPFLNTHPIQKQCNWDFTEYWLLHLFYASNCLSPRLRPPASVSHKLFMPLTFREEDLRLAFPSTLLSCIVNKPFLCCKPWCLCFGLLHIKQMKLVHNSVC